MPRSSHSPRFYHPNIIGWGVQIIKLSPKVSKNNSITALKYFQQPWVELLCWCAGIHSVLLYATHQQFLFSLPSFLSCSVRPSQLLCIVCFSTIITTVICAAVTNKTLHGIILEVQHSLFWSLDAILHSNMFVTKLSEPTRVHCKR